MRLDDDDDGAGRYAVVHVALGIEILLRARLLTKESPLVECSVCHEVAGFADVDGYHCGFCCVNKGGETAVDDHMSEVLGLNGLNAYDTVTRGSEWPQYECDFCLADTMAPVDVTDQTRLCFSCGNSEDTDGYRDFDGEID